MSSTSEPLNIWCLLDGRPGHQNQVLGLAEALQRQTSTNVAHIPLSRWLRGMRVLAPGTSKLLKDYGRPNLVIGAGHRSHLPLITTTRLIGGQSVLLMRPTVPLQMFDHCLVSDTDHAVRDDARVIHTRGVLNRIQPAETQLADQGLILVGGPSRHFDWSDDDVFSQILLITEQTPEIRWTVATSRRTPAKFLEHCHRVQLSADIVRPEDVDSSWLPATLSRMPYAWVTQDSVSMTFEALTAGCRVGVLELTARRNSRLASRAVRLVDSGDVTRWSDWNESGMLSPPQTEYREADRCAAIILQRLAAADGQRNAS